MFSNWHKASASVGMSNCVEVGNDATRVGVRDTKLGDASPVLLTSPANWSAFLGGIRAGTFDLR